ncbi:MAG TPA: ATP-dependent helicase HrpB [Steroidobacteraceae bacterium]|nr:ATP-dependent helicase HrpB [Steroidobacteraceae bacterium]
MPAPRLPSLPIAPALAPLAEALASRTRVLLHAPPGAGKSTIVPLALLENARLPRGKILMLEPRRIAARAVASRMASLRGEEVGATVGFRTRTETRVSRGTRIEVVTEGILTRMLQSDPALEGIGCVIFDEFHERSLNADLGLALAIESQETLREELRLLVMSATLDLAPLAALLRDAPIITAEGRSHAVATHYVARRAEMSLELQTAQVVRAALAREAGDILCFLPGAAEIRRVQRSLEEAAADPAVKVMPLYGDLTAAEQDAALRPSPAGCRKIVLATSIAETSLTIEGIRIVVDTGLRRYSEFDPVTGMSRLVTGKVSQAAADQRRGRAGRLSDGVCYRLWSEGAQASLAAHTPAEILSADLAPLALELCLWGAPDGAKLRWLDPPPAAPLAQARALLCDLEAIDAANRITEHGRKLAGVGAHPRLAHMLVKGRDLGAPRLACDLAAILSERDLLRAAPGARDVDLRLRVAVLRGDTGSMSPGLTVDGRALREAARRSADWQRTGGGGSGMPTRETVDSTGILIAMAYPDRIGRARDTAGRYVLANGRGARFGEPQALAKSEFIVAAELDGAEREARIFLAAPIERADIERHFAAHIRVTDEIAWDERERAVRARRVRRLAELVLETGELRNPDRDAVLRAALQGLRRLGLDALPWTKELRQWQARVSLMRHHAVPAPDPWPDLSDAALSATLEEWAPPWMDGLVRHEHFARFDLSNALRSRLSYAQGTILDREAPTHFVVPSGSRIPIDYLDGEVPTLSVRLQEVFGLSETPAVAAGGLPLILKLLSPAGRPVQITRDLVSFWSRGYHEVRKDLKGRYPKHYWPEDPHAAEPTRRVRPRTAR